TDVDGVYTADPRKVPTARKLDVVTYDEMLELATLGAGVLHNRSVELAKKFGVQLVVRSSLNTTEGTVVMEGSKMEKMLGSGGAGDCDTTRIDIIGLKDEPGVAFKLFNSLAKHNINIDMILQSVGRHGTKDISFTTNEDSADEAAKIISENFSEYESLDVNKEVAKVSIVGAGMQTNAGVAAKMFEALYDENINIRMISTSEIRVTVLINEKNLERAMNAIHEKFNLGDN
ncbi:MAG: aspartate kinase, partial [Lachnospiraceae bacterium]|nr:aspartate kinase [Lachnospiraceae bacterium]